MAESASANRRSRSGSRSGRAVNMQWLYAGEDHTSRRPPSGTRRSLRTVFQKELPSASASARPLGTAGAGLAPPVEDGAHHFHFAGPGITMFAYIAVEAQGSVFPALAHALLLQK